MMMGRAAAHKQTTISDTRPSITVPTKRALMLVVPTCAKDAKPENTIDEEEQTVM
jgi:hypothetical protein